MSSWLITGQPWAEIVLKILGKGETVHLFQLLLVACQGVTWDGQQGFRWQRLQILCAHTSRLIIPISLGKNSLKDSWKRGNSAIVYVIAGGLHRNHLGHLVRISSPIWNTIGGSEKSLLPDGAINQLWLIQAPVAEFEPMTSQFVILHFGHLWQWVPSKIEQLNRGHWTVLFWETLLFILQI